MKPIILSGLFLVFSSLLAGQNTLDTIALARHFKSEGKLRSAAHLLDNWRRAHPFDVDVLWLYAQNEYWRKNFKRSRRLYREALALQPDNLYLRLDFTENLLNMEQYNKANGMLAAMSWSEKQDPYAQFIRAKRLYWLGDNRAAADLALAAQQSGSKDAAELLREIGLARSPWTRFAVNYSFDTQPLSGLEPIWELGIPYSNWLDLRFRTNLQQFRKDRRSTGVSQMELGNTWRIPATGTTIGASMGIMQWSNGPFEWSAGLDLTQPLWPGLRLHTGGAQKPYLYTRASIDTSLVFQSWSADLEWREPHGFWVKAGAQAEIFSDHNQVSTFWGWMLTPPLKLGGFSGRIGYAYSYSDALDSRYYSEKSLADLLSLDSTAHIAGIYTPYFTPNDMTAHAVLALLECRLSKYVDVTLNGKYGLWARALNPRLSLDADPNGAVVVRRDFYANAFTPFEAGAKLNVRLSERLALEGKYTFTRIFFYDVQTAGGTLKIIF